MTQIQRKKLTILDIMRDPTISKLDKKVKWDMWKFNQLPPSYRKDHLEDVQREIQKLIRDVELNNTESKGGEIKK